MNKMWTLVLLVLGGCANLTPQDIQRDVAAIHVPDAWIFAPTQEQREHEQEWWRAYGSNELNQLIKHALVHNQDLRNAALNWQKARLAYKQRQAEDSVSFNAAISGNISRPLQQDTHSRQDFGSQFSASYQLDLWQKLGVVESSAAWQTEATGEDQLAARLSLIGEVVRSYIDLAWIDTQIRLNNQALDYQHNRVERMRARYALGDVAQIEVVRSEQAQNQQQQVATDLDKNRQAQLMQLAVLIGEPPSLLNVTPPPIAMLTRPNLDLPMPASLLRQRPDLRAAQYRLQQKMNDIAIAEQAFYPDINLNAGLSTGGVVLSQLLSNPLGSLSASITLPFLQHQQLTLRKKASEMSYQQALNDFEALLYRALQDVNAALLTIQHNQAQHQLLEKALQQARQIAQISKDSYQLGASSLQDVLDAEQNQRDAQRNLLANHYELLSATINLALALGGGNSVQYSEKSSNM